MMRVRIVVPLALVLSACPATVVGPDGGPQAGGGSTGGGRTGGGGGKATGGGTGGAGGGTTASLTPELMTLAANVAGRTGRDLRLGLTGKDHNRDTISVWVRMLDSVGGPVVALDTNRDGVADAAEGALTLEGKKWVTDTVTASATARGIFAMGVGVSQVGVKLIDATGLESEEQITSVVDQAVQPRGASCDPLFVANRCEPSLGCRGTPAKCDEGLAPTVGRMAFYRGATGPTILIEGTEPEDDLATIRFQFQNAQGQPISIDSNGDGAPDLASFDQDALQLAVDGTFFVRMLSGADLDQQVPKLVAIPIDVAGHTGPPKTAAPSNIPVRNAGQACDARGFDTCGPNLSCSPGILGVTNKCAAAGPMRTTQCAAAPVIIASTEGGVAMGTAEGGSLWDAPAGCSSADPTGRPEGVVMVRVTERAAKLRLSTVGPGTSFDTTLYVMPGCSGDSSTAMACVDDVPNGAGASELVLEDVQPGDYLVVVDSFDPTGGAFELRVTVE